MDTRCIEYTPLYNFSTRKYRTGLSVKAEEFLA